MKITKNNFNEKMDLIAKALIKSEYDRECFSKSDIELNTIVWREFDKVCTELAEAKVNFEKFVLPILSKHNIELNEEKVEEIKQVNKLDELPDNLLIELNCPYLDNPEKW